MNWESVTVYVTKEDALKIGKLCEELPYLSCVSDVARDCGQVLGENIYAVDLFFDKQD